MEKYKFLHHTGDAKFQAFGASLEEAFCHAALATASLMWDWRNVQKKIEHRVKIEAIDLEQLLVNFLEEVLYLLGSKMFLLGSAEVMRIQEKGDRFFLDALFKGDQCSDRYEIYGDVKAITYSEMEISRNEHFTIQVVVDV